MAGQGGQGRAGGRAGDFTVAFGHGHPLVCQERLYELSSPKMRAQCEVRV